MSPSLQAKASIDLMHFQETGITNLPSNFVSKLEKCTCCLRNCNLYGAYKLSDCELHRTFPIEACILKRRVFRVFLDSTL